jgi:large subunit ribosomal protein L9
MARNMQLLLTENVDNLGIVGDLVNVRLGYARNYLLPRGFATTPSEDRIKELAVKRADAEKMLAELRAQREQVAKKIDGLEITIQRACNDQGILYGAVTQQDLARALGTLGHDVKPREIRLPHTVKRVDSYEILVKFDQDLDATIKLWVEPDRAMQAEEREEMEFDNEGNLVERPGKKEPRAQARAEAQ